MSTHSIHKIILRGVMLVSFMVFFNDTFAVGEFGGNDDPDVSGPVDGGLTILLTAGAAYGARKLYQHKKQDAKK